MSEHDKRIEDAFRQLGGESARGRGVDLADVDGRMRARRTRRAALGGSLATLLVIGAVGFAVQQSTAPGGGGTGGGSAGVASGARGDASPESQAPEEPRSSDVTLTTPSASSMTVSDFTASCELAGLDGGRGRSPVLEIQGMEVDGTSTEDVRFAQALLRISEERVAPGESWQLAKPTYDADDDVLFFGLVDEAENSTRDEGTDVVIEVVDGAGCRPGSVVSVRVDGTVGSEEQGGELMQVSGTLSATVRAKPGVVDTTGQVASDCAAIRADDVPEFENADVEVLGDGPYGTVTLGSDGTQFLVDFEDRSCRNAPGIGRLITGPSVDRESERLPGAQQDAAASPAESARGLAFARFAADPTAARATEAGFSRDGVTLYAGGERLGEIAYADLTDSSAWDVSLDAGTTSALSVVRAELQRARLDAESLERAEGSPILVDRVPLPLCASPDPGMPFGGEVIHLRGVVVSESSTECAGAWRIDLLLEDDAITAVALAVREP